MISKKNMTKLVGTMAASFLLCSCASLISGNTATVTIDGSIDEPVTIITSYDVYPDTLLPIEVKVRRRHLDGQHIKIQSTNYSFHDIILHKTINPWAIGSFAIYGVGGVIDLLTNAVSDPVQKKFLIKPNGPSSQADSLLRVDSIRWEKMRQIKLQARQLPEQYYRHEINIGVGFGANQSDNDRNQMVNSYMEKYRLEPLGDCFDLSSDTYVSANVEYHYRLNRKWDIGAFATWGVSTDSYREKDVVYDDPTHRIEASEKCNIFAISPSVRYTWYEDRSLRAYFRVAAGVMRHHLRFDYHEYPLPPRIAEENYSNIVVPTYNNDALTSPYYDDTNQIKWKMAWQVTPLAVSMGNTQYRFFAELGYGCLGVFRMGMSLTF